MFNCPRAIALADPYATIKTKPLPVEESKKRMSVMEQQALSVGLRVRVKTPTIVYHHPDHRNEPFDIQGMEGEIFAILSDWQGRPISPNYPIQVRFSPKFIAHLHPDELEVI